MSWFMLSRQHIKEKSCFIAIIYLRRARCCVGGRGSCRPGSPGRSGQKGEPFNPTIPTNCHCFFVLLYYCCQNKRVIDLHISYILTLLRYLYFEIRHHVKNKRNVLNIYYPVPISLYIYIYFIFSSCLR